jgi:hypothetical protein
MLISAPKKKKQKQKAPTLIFPKNQHDINKTSKQQKSAKPYPLKTQQ